MIVVVKSIHTLLYLLMSGCVLYILYGGVTGDGSPLLMITALAVLGEMIALACNNWRCPLTALAQRLGDETGDEYIAEYCLPDWAVPLVVPVCGVLLWMGILLVLVRLLLV